MRKLPICEQPTVEIEGFKPVFPEECFDPEQLAIGIEVEGEHTEEPHKRSVIARAHLAEREDYYTLLKKYVES